MKILAPDIEQAVESKEDIFGRDTFAAGLLRVFERSDDPLVVALDEPWGSGKTVFAKRLARKAKEEGFKVVYFDAFKRDYDPDVFVSLVAQILDAGAASKERKDLKSKAKGVAKIVGRVAIKGAIRGLTAGVVRAGDFDDASEEVAAEVGNVAEAELDRIIDKRLSDANKEQKAFDGFREVLTNFSTKKADGKPLVFIIDELDRCRPTFAISVLETIKHFFSVKNVHFLLVCQIDQLSAATKKMYGNDIDSLLYLEKFIHFKINFPRLQKREASALIKKFAGSVLKDMPEDDEGGRLKEGFSEFASNIWMLRGYSLRRIERICTLFGLCMAFTTKRHLRFPAIVHILCDLKISNPELFSKAKDGSVTYEEIKKNYGFSDEPEDRDHPLDWYAMNWRYYLASEEGLKEFDTRGFNSHLFDYSVRREDVVQIIANKIVERFEFPQSPSS